MKGLTEMLPNHYLYFNLYLYYLVINLICCLTHFDFVEWHNVQFKKVLFLNQISATGLSFVHHCTYIHTRFVGLLVQILLLDHSKTMKCFNLFRFLYWATMTCSERSEQQQTCVLHKLVNILIQSSKYGVRVFVWRIKTNFVSRQRRLKSYVPLPLKICLQPQTKLWYSSFSTLFRLSSNSYHESTFHSVRSAQLWVLRLHGIGWGKPHFYFTSD